MNNSPLSTRVAVFVYGVLAYAAGFATLLYIVGFLGNFVVPKTIDGTPTAPLATALLTDFLLVALFAIQHSVMARPFFKRWIHGLIPAAAERSTYLLASSLALFVLFRFWQPLGGVVWSVDQPAVRLLLQVGYGLGWIVLFAATFMISHFELFGLSQIWAFLRGHANPKLRFATPGLYGVVRHPIYVGWLMTFWFTPLMTFTHLFFALMTTAYILVAIQFEERDLADAHPEYHDYRRRTPMLFPRLRRTEETN